MGRGNWIPKTDEEYNLVYVELMPPGEEGEEGAEVEQHQVDDELAIRSEIMLANLRSEIMSVLGKSFEHFDPHHNRREAFEGLERDEVRICQNGVVEVIMDCQADFWHIGLAVVARKGAPKFAASKVDYYAKKLWKALDAYGFALSVRTSAWTSASFKPE